MNWQALIHGEIEASISSGQQVQSELCPGIEQASCWIAEAIESGGKLLLFGNGGSAADAQHIAGELVGRFMLDRKAIPAIALTTDTSILTSVANDLGFDQVFSRQIEALAKPGDIVMAISTSGNSPNLRLGIDRAKNLNLKVIGLLGRDGGEASKSVDLPLIVSADGTSPRIQESHIMIGHIICKLVEKILFDNQEKDNE